MERYKVKIENKYNASTINKKYTFPKIKERTTESPNPFVPKTAINSLNPSA